MANNKIIQRAYKIEKVRAQEADGKRTIGGYAAVFGQRSENMGFFLEVYETIERGAFAASLQQDDQFAFWNHDNNFPIGRKSAGSLRLNEDDHGLAFELDLPDTSIGRDVYENVRTGIIDSMSFGFIPKEETIVNGEKPSDPIIRNIIKAELIEVSPVVFPAYPQTEVEARAKACDKEIEALLKTKISFDVSPLLRKINLSELHARAILR